MTIPFAEAIRRFEPVLPLMVAYSGGADSSALLLACARKWPGQVVAAHVHHGLQDAADGFASHCERVCLQLGIPLAVRLVDARHRPGESPEDAARRARYAALAAMALEGMSRLGGCELATAQHADDQVETVLLALSRGAGLAGLSGMPARRELRFAEQAVSLHRPLLQVSAPDIRQWLGQQGLAFVEDPTNSSEALTRNRIRARILPALSSAFPAFRDTFARSAGHAAQARELLREVALEDLHRIGLPPAVAALRGLSRSRQANLLRHWLQAEHGATASTAQIEELQKQLAACTTAGHDISIRVGQGWVKRLGERMDWLADTG